MTATIIYAFVLGLMFVAGILVGGWLISRGVQGELTEERRVVLEHYGRVEDRLALYVKHTGAISETLMRLAAPAKHVYWGAGEADCPREIKATTGELHTLRCKVCGKDDPRGVCAG